jgi:DUF971 family protein
MRLKIEPCHTQPTDIKLHQKSAILEIHYDNGNAFHLPCEYLRVYTPSAESLGHGPGQEILQIGKEHVTITAIKPVGQYAIQPTFSDGHSTGIYSWDLLYKLGNEYQSLWADYLNRLTAAGYARQVSNNLE